MSTEDDTIPALVQKIRVQGEEIIVLKGELAKSRVDSLRIELLRGTTIQGLEWQLAQTIKMLPKWYEKPALVITVSVLVTIWAVLKAVSISI